MSQLLNVVIIFLVFNKNSNAFSTNREKLHDILEAVKNPRSRAFLDNYHRLRKLLIDEELNTGFGSEVILNDQEKLANGIVMKAKAAEYNGSIEHPERFIPSRHIFERLEEIKESKLFQIIRKMPKGGILHAHSKAICSTDFMVSLTYMPDLWQLTDKTTGGIRKFRFSLVQPESKKAKEEWRLVSAIREEMRPVNYDVFVRSLFTLHDKNVNPNTQFNDINDVWKRFLDIFQLVDGIFSYAPAFKAYYKIALKEILEDGVQYLELRGPLTKLYDLNNNTYTPDDITQIYIDTLNEFKSENPTFIGSKLIYSGTKNVPSSNVARYIECAQRLRKKFPDFIAGFDLVGQEDTTSPIVEFAEQISEIPDDLHLFFHAGETNSFGGADENLVDAILLGSRRIGHGYALAKHPKLMELVKERNIAIEINPVSNQVLKLVDDYRNHPASVLLANNVSVVISSDDPSFWESTPLSHDFYMAFLGVASYHSDLRVLKKFAINSIEFSSLSPTEKVDAFAKWENEWNHFIDDLVNDESKKNRMERK